jgi:hypothetical protein
VPRANCCGWIRNCANALGAPEVGQLIVDHRARRGNRACSHERNRIAAWLDTPAKQEGVLGGP